MRIAEWPKHEPRVIKRSHLAPALSITASWLAFAWAFHDPHYNKAAVFASAGTIFGASWFFQWRPSPEWAPLRLIGFAAFVHAFLSSGFSVVSRIEAGRLMFTPAPGAFSFAATSAFAFTSMFVAGVYGTMLVLRRKEQPDERAYLPNWLAWTLAGAVAAYSLANVLGWTLLARFGNLPTIAFKTPLVLGLLIATQVLQKRSMRWQLAMIIGVQLIEVLLKSMLGAVLLPIRDVIFTLFHLRKRFPWQWIMALVGFMVIFNPAKHIVREQLFRDGGSRGAFESTERAFQAWGDALERTWSFDSPGSTDAERHLRTTLTRLDYNWAGALIYTLVPRALPHEGGRTYEDIPMVLVPRVLYPDKPSSQDYFRTRWTIRLGIQTWEGAKRTAIAIPAAGEAYWNFGWLGVLLIPLAVGLGVGGLVYLAPSNPVAHTAYMVLVAASLTSFVDMLIWHIPQFIVVAMTAVLLRVYIRTPPKVSAKGHSRATSA